MCSTTSQSSVRAEFRRRKHSGMEWNGKSGRMINACSSLTIYHFYLISGYAKLYQYHFCWWWRRKKRPSGRDEHSLQSSWCVCCVMFSYQGFIHATPWLERFSVFGWNDFALFYFNFLLAGCNAAQFCLEGDKLIILSWTRTNKVFMPERVIWWCC